METGPDITQNSPHFRAESIAVAPNLKQPIIAWPPLPAKEKRSIPGDDPAATRSTASTIALGRRQPRHNPASGGQLTSAFGVQHNRKSLQSVFQQYIRSLQRPGHPFIAPKGVVTGKSPQVTWRLPTQRCPFPCRRRDSLLGTDCVSISPCRKDYGNGRHWTRTSDFHRVRMDAQRWNSILTKDLRRPTRPLALLLAPGTKKTITATTRLYRKPGAMTSRLTIRWPYSPLRLPGCRLRTVPDWLPCSEDKAKGLPNEWPGRYNRRKTGPGGAPVRPPW